MLWYSLEVPQRGANEYPQHMNLWRNKKNIMWIPPLSVAMIVSLLQFFFVCATVVSHVASVLSLFVPQLSSS